MPMTIQYDPQAESERPVRLPDAPLKELGPGIKLQPPLSRRGHGPGIIVVLPSRLSLRPHAKVGLKTPLDPDPVQKWAEEGFAVVGVQLSANSDITETLAVAIAGLESCPEVDNKGHHGVLGECPLRKHVSRRVVYGRLRTCLSWRAFALRLGLRTR